MFKAQLYINGTEMTNFVLSDPFKDTIDIELDKLLFQVKSPTKLSFQKWDKIEYKLSLVDGSSTRVLLDKYFTLFDWVDTFEGEYWLHEITAFSPTKILESIIINGMAETYPSASLYAQLVRVIAKINAQIECENWFYVNGITPNEMYLQLGGTIPSELTSASATDFLWDGQNTAREILNDILSKIDCMIVATDYEYSGSKITTIYLQIEKLDKQNNTLLNGGNLSEIGTMVKGYSYHRNSEFACGNLISLIKNGITKNNNQQQYLPARNTDLTIDDASKWCIITQEPIYSLNSVKVMINVLGCTMSVSNNGNVVYTIPNIVLTAYVDITNYIVEKSVFDAMSLSDQSKHLYFIRGEKNIYGLYDRYKSGLTGLFSNTAIQNILSEWNNSHFPVNQPLTPISSQEWFASDMFGHFNNDYTTFTKAVNDPTILGDTYFNNYGSVADIVPSNFYYNYQTSLATNYKNLLYSVNYQPYVSTAVKVSKTNTDNQRYINTSLIKNQSDRTIDTTKYLLSQKSLANRIGNDELSVDVMFDTPNMSNAYFNNIGGDVNKLWQLGDKLIMGSTWLLTSREISVDGEKLKCRFVFSKNYNATNSAINVNRDKRLYGIPLNQYVDRYIFVKKRFAGLTTDVILLQGCYDDFTGGNSTYGYFMLETSKISGGSITHSIAGTYDNYSAGIIRTKTGNTIVNVFIRYTGDAYSDDNGYEENIQFYTLTNDEYSRLPISDYSRLPFIEYTIQIWQPLENGQLGTRFTLNGIKKDKMERLIFVLID